jgi:hypothetical protein
LRPARPRVRYANAIGRQHAKPLIRIQARAVLPFAPAFHLALLPHVTNQIPNNVSDKESTHPQLAQPAPSAGQQRLRLQSSWRCQSLYTRREGLQIALSGRDKTVIREEARTPTAGAPALHRPSIQYSDVTGIYLRRLATGRWARNKKARRLGRAVEEGGKHQGFFFFNLLRAGQTTARYESWGIFCSMG